MAIPGFNAETALYKTSVDYRSHAVSLPLVGAVPQLVAPPATVCGPCVGVVGFRYQVCHRAPVSPGTASIFYDSVIGDNAGTPRLKVPPCYDQRSMMEGARK